MAVFVEIIFISIVIEPAGSYAAPASEAVPFPSISAQPDLFSDCRSPSRSFRLSCLRSHQRNLVSYSRLLYLPLPAGKEFSSFCIYQIPGRTYCQPAYGTVFLLIYGVVSKRYGAVCIQIVGMRYPFSSTTVWKPASFTRVPSSPNRYVLSPTFWVLLQMA